MWSRWTCCLSLLALAACAGAPEGAQVTINTTKKLASPPVATTSLSGVVVAPAGMTASASNQLISNDGGSIISQDGAGLISQDGAGAIQRKLQAVATRPLAGASVVAVDAGHKVVARATTDAKGRYELKGLPRGVCLVQVSVKTASGQPGVLATLADPGKSTSADVDLATTIMAVRTVQAKPLTAVDVESFQANVRAVADKLASVPDVAHPQAMAQQVDDLTANLPSPAPTATPTATPTAAPPLPMLAGTGSPGATDGPGLAATFNAPGALALVGRYLFVADDGNRALRRLYLDDITAPVTTLATTLTFPLGLAAGPDALYASGAGMFKLTPEGQATRLADDADGPRGLALTANGNLLVAVPTTHQLKAVGVADPSFSLRPVAGGASDPLNQPVAVAVNGTEAYVACAGDGRIVLAQATGGDADPRRTSTFASGFDRPAALAFVDGLGLVVADAERVAVAKDGRTLAANLGHPGGLAWDGARRRLYVADTDHHVIRYVAIP